MYKKIKHGLAIGLVILLGFLLGTLGFSLWDKPPIPLENVKWSSQAQWIGSSEPSYRLYARRSFNVTESIQGGWLRLSADNDFVLYVNGKIIAHEVGITDNGNGFTDKLSEQSQRFYHHNKHLFLPPSRVFGTNEQDWKLTTYVDLSDFLRFGDNLIAVEVQKSRQTPRLVVEGKVSLNSGNFIDLTTGSSDWKVANLAENFQGFRWFEPQFSAQNWREAQVLGAITETTYSRVNPHLFERPLRGYWITGTETPQGEVWLRQTWQIPPESRRVFLRFAGDGEYALLLNGRLVNHYRANTKEQLNLYDVTNLVHSGVNVLGVRLARPLVNQKIEPLAFLLDGWVETDQGKEKAPIVTDSSWSTLINPDTNWFAQVEASNNATLVRSPNSQSLHRIYEGDADELDIVNFFWHSSWWSLGGIGFSLSLAWCLGYCWKSSGAAGQKFQTGAALLFPATLFLLGVELLKYRYLEAERGLWFEQLKSNPVIFVLFITIIVWTLLLSRFNWRSFDSPSLILSRSQGFIIGLLLSSLLIVSLRFWQQKLLPFSITISLFFLVGLLLLILTFNWSKFNGQFPSWLEWTGLITLVIIGFFLRVYQLDNFSIHPDETVSWDTAKGILNTGKPVLASGVLYTRSPFFHYSLALWLRVWGDSLFNARLFSVFWGVATLILMYFFGRKITGKRWVALMIVAILVFDSWSIMESRLVRYYQPGQFLVILSLWMVLKGFVEGGGRKYQLLFYIFMTLTILNQEINVIFIPSFFLGFLFFYRPFNLKQDWSIIVGCSTVMVITIYDILVFNILCLTPSPALSTNTDSVTKFHFFNVPDFFAIFFSGVNQAHIIYTIFFFLGLIYCIKQENTKLFYIFSIVLVNLGVITVLVMQIGFRYTYGIYSLFILLSINGAIVVMENLAIYFSQNSLYHLPFRRISLVFLGMLLLSSIEFQRVFGGYQEPIFSQTDKLFQYIGENYQSHDIVITSAPAGAAVYLEKIDYFLPLQTPFPFDAFYWKNGRLIDRWAGGKILTNLDQMDAILEKTDRAWILLDNNSVKDQNLKIITYFETLGKPVKESFGARLRLWQKEDGFLPRIPNQGGDLGSY